jgi:hypothetical protein
MCSIVGVKLPIVLWVGMIMPVLGVLMFARSASLLLHLVLDTKKVAFRFTIIVLIIRL